MDIERDEMFRLMSVKISKWRYASRNVIATAGKPAISTVAGKGGKGDTEKPAGNAHGKPVSSGPICKTPAGQKKDLAEPMAAAYQPKEVEAAWYAWWEKSGFFHADAQKVIQGKKAYSMVIPPPNVTGALHLGHALMLAIQDAIMRYKRMSGYETLWTPGCDHAGISTQSVVENQLWKQKKQTRHDYGRDDFVKLVWQWKNEYGGKINN